MTSQRQKIERVVWVPWYAISREWHQVWKPWKFGLQRVWPWQPRGGPPRRRKVRCMPLKSGRSDQLLGCSPLYSRSRESSLSKESKKEILLNIFLRALFNTEGIIYSRWLHYMITTTIHYMITTSIHYINYF